MGEESIVVDQIRNKGGRPIEQQAAEGSWARLLSAMRERAGITRAEMARRLGVTPPQATRWESGRVDIGESVVRRYAAALQLRPVLVFEPEEEGPDAPS